MSAPSTNMSHVKCLYIPFIFFLLLSISCFLHQACVWLILQNHKKTNIFKYCEVPLWIENEEFEDFLICPVYQHPHSTLIELLIWKYVRLRIQWRTNQASGVYLKKKNMTSSSCSHRNAPVCPGLSFSSQAKPNTLMYLTNSLHTHLGSKTLAPKICPRNPLPSDLITNDDPTRSTT